MGGMGRYESSGKELGAKEGQVVMKRDELGFCVKMVNAGHLHVGSCSAEF